MPAGKGLGMLPEESKQDVPYAQGGVQAAVGRRDKDQGGGMGVGEMRLERKRKRKIVKLLCYGWDSLDSLGVTRKQGRRLS